MPIIKTASSELVIIEDFYDQVCLNNSPNDDCIFNFEEDYRPKSRKMRELIDKSSILEEDDDINSYNIVE